MFRDFALNTGFSSKMEEDICTRFMKIDFCKKTFSIFAICTKYYTFYSERIQNFPIYAIMKTKLQFPSQNIQVVLFALKIETQMFKKIKSFLQ